MKDGQLSVHTEGVAQGILKVINGRLAKIGL